MANTLIEMQKQYDEISAFYSGHGIFIVRSELSRLLSNIKFYLEVNRKHLYFTDKKMEMLLTGQNDLNHNFLNYVDKLSIFSRTLSKCSQNDDAFLIMDKKALLFFNLRRPLDAHLLYVQIREGGNGVYYIRNCRKMHGFVLYLLGRNEEALKLFLKSDGTINTEVLGGERVDGLSAMLVNCFWELKRFDEALQWADEAVKLSYNAGKFQTANYWRSIKLLINYDKLMQANLSPDYVGVFLGYKKVSDNECEVLGEEFFMVQSRAMHRMANLLVMMFYYGTGVPQEIMAALKSQDVDKEIAEYYENAAKLCDELFNIEYSTLFLRHQTWARKATILLDQARYLLQKISHTIDGDLRPLFDEARAAVVQAQKCFSEALSMVKGNVLYEKGMKDAELLLKDVDRLAAKVEPPLKITGGVSRTCCM